MTYRTTMERSDKPRSGPALGGIGAGFFELHQDGVFRNWNIFNNVPLGTGAPMPFADDGMLFFIVRYEVEGEQPQMKILQIDSGYKVGAIENHYYSFPWLTGVDRIESEASFPFVTMRYADEEMPLDIELQAWSPFIPHDAKNSSLPVAFFDFRVKSRARKPVHVMLTATTHNAVGYDVEDKSHVTRFPRRRGRRQVEFTEERIDPAHSTCGSQGLASLSSDSTYYTGWEAEHPYYEVVIRSRKLPNFDDTAARNWKNPADGKLYARWGVYGTLAVSRTLHDREGFEHTFVKGWHFPNLYSHDRSHIEGHYYSNFFDSAGDVVDYAVRHREDLHARTRRFHDDFRDSTAPEFVLDQVNSQLNTFFTSTWLTKDMDFGVMEGLRPDKSFGPLATIDVSMYGAMSPLGLFPELQKNMMRAHRRLQLPDGEIVHGLMKDFRKADVNETVTSRLDMPSQYVMLTLLGWFTTGDRAYLQEMWPSVCAALDYVLEKRDHNGDCLPDMEGVMCSYDNFAMWGVSSYVASLWLGALRMAVEAARALKDEGGRAKYAAVLAKGTAAFEDALWTGEYYCLFNDAGGEHGLDDGCMTDQLIGQWACDIAGLGDLLPKARVRRALRTICRISRQPWGLVNCRWPDDDYLHDVPEDCWHDQANTPWTGVELAFASFLIYRGLLRDGLGVVENVDTRYRKSGMYWDHIEFGGHYYRPMSAWAIIGALAGLTVNDGRYSFAPKVSNDDVRLFFSFAGGWGHYERRARKASEVHTISVSSGTLVLRGLSCSVLSRKASRASIALDGGGKRAGEAAVHVSPGRMEASFRPTLRLKAGEALRATVR